MLQWLWLAAAAAALSWPLAWELPYGAGATLKAGGGGGGQKNNVTTI